MGEWKKTALGEVLDFGNGKSRPMEEGSVPVYGGNGILGYTNRSNYSDKTIAIGRVGAYCGAVYFEDGPVWISDNALAAKAKAGNDALFFYYLLKNADLNQHAGGSSHPLVTQTLLNSLEFSICRDEEEQRAIASVLSSLDAKIDLLHRQNKTLEGMAEALFRQWFVEGADEEAADGTLADVAVNIRDGVPVNAFNADDRYVALEHIDRRCIALEQFGSSADVASNKYRFSVNDILFGKLRPYFHKVCLTSFAGICSTDILVIRPKQPELLYYCLFAFFQDEVVEYANAGSGGTRMPRTSWSDLSKYPIALPGKEKLESFNKVVKPMMDKLQANIPQIRSLTALRDTLLPKLISGEVRMEINERREHTLNPKTHA